MHSDTEIEDLIFKWQGNPSQYTSLLVEQVYSSLRTLCEMEVKYSANTELSLPVSASSLVNDVFIKLKNGVSEDRVTSIKTFYNYLQRIVKQVLIDRHRHMQAHKRSFDYPNNSKAKQDYKDVFESIEDTSYDFEILIAGLEKLHKVEPDIVDALSYKYFAARNVNQISLIMNKSPRSIENYLHSGKQLLKDLIFDGVHVPV
jgi:RNA polymerase sigma factor (sigma-70 family)